MLIAPAICCINIIWFIIISCSIIGFVIAAIAFISMPGMPFMGNPPFIIIMFGSPPPFVMLSIRAWTSS